MTSICFASFVKPVNTLTLVPCGDVKVTLVLCATAAVESRARHTSVANLFILFGFVAAYGGQVDQYINCETEKHSQREDAVDESEARFLADAAKRQYKNEEQYPADKEYRLARALAEGELLVLHGEHRYA